MLTENYTEALVLAGMFDVTGLIVGGREIYAPLDSLGRWDTKNETLVMVIDDGGKGRVFVGKADEMKSETQRARERLILTLCPNQGVIIPGADLTKISAMQLASVAGCPLESATVVG